MKFNVERLKEIAVPMSEEERDEMAFREAFSGWLRFSASVYLKGHCWFRLLGTPNAAHSFLRLLCSVNDGLMSLFKLWRKLKG